ncbi:unnamed protein product [Brassica oleracea]
MTLIQTPSTSPSMRRSVGEIQVINRFGVFSDLKTGKCSSVVEARLLRYWEARNVKRGGELMWVDMLLVDVNATMMQATISAHRLPQYQERLTAGAMYSIADFYVARCAQNFRLSDSSLMIRFNKSTSFDEIDDPVSAFPEEAFRFRDQSELLGLANTNTQLPDIIGEILSVKSTVTDPPEEKNRVMVTIKMNSNDTVTLSLFVLKLLLSTNNLRPCVLIRRSLLLLALTQRWLEVVCFSMRRPEHMCILTRRRKQGKFDSTS